MAERRSTERAELTVGSLFVTTPSARTVSAVVTMMYRTMAADADKAHRPGLGPEDLGCRVDRPGTPGPYDVRPDANGMVGTKPKAEGMSAFDDYRQLPAHLKPSALGGTSDRPLWKMPVPDLPDSLDFVQSGRSHGVVAPTEPVHIDDYEQALVSTRADWGLCHV